MKEDEKKGTSRCVPWHDLIGRANEHMRRDFYIQFQRRLKGQIGTAVTQGSLRGMSFAPADLLLPNDVVDLTNAL